MRFMAVLVLAVFGFGLGVARASDKVAQIEIKLSQDEAKGDGRYTTCTLDLKNATTRSLTLVKPGDGSNCGWRTPVIEWVWLKDGKPVPVVHGGRCGNISALRAGETFTLKPGEEMKLDGQFPYPQPGPGTYQLKLRYTNTPELKWSGVPLGRHNGEEMARVLGSDAAYGESNAIDVTVPEPEKK